MAFLQYTALCLETIAAVDYARGGEAKEAVLFLAAADALHERTGSPPFGRRRERVLASTRAELGEPTFAAA